MVFFFKKFLTIILDFILPRRCLACGDFTQQNGTACTFESVSQPSICGTCWQQLSFITKPCCLNCGAPLAFDGDACRSCFNKAFMFDSARAVFVYNEASKTMITRFKHGGQTGYARLFAPWMRNIVFDFFDDDQNLVNENNWDAVVVEDEVVSEGGEGCLGDSGDGFGAHKVGSKEVRQVSLTGFSGMVEMDSEDM